MNEIILVTGNAHKLQEWQQLMPPEVKLSSVDLDLPELQSDDSGEVVSDYYDGDKLISVNPLSVLRDQGIVKR